MNRARRPASEQARDLLTLHKRERSGVLVLMTLLLLLLVYAGYLQWFREPPQEDMAAMEAELLAWMAAREAAALPIATAEPFPFDPNTLDRDGWLALGLRERQVDGILRYMEKGGAFRVKRDVARLYGLRAEDYQRLEPYIQLPDSLPRQRAKPRPPSMRAGGYARMERYPKVEQGRTPRTFQAVEVNTADSAMLVALPGIGPSFARGILAYRDKLGGYRNLEQLAEVYVLRDKPDALARVMELLVVDSLMVERIPINTCTVEELAAHPYITWKQARPLIAYRAQHGPFQQVADIRKCLVIDEDTFLKLAPYLSVE